MKPDLLVAADGYILNIHGAYFADARNNGEMKSLEKDSSKMRASFSDDNMFSVDGGYCDVISYRTSG